MTMTAFQLVDPRALRGRMNGANTPRLVDVRDLDEFAVLHVEGAQCTPLPQLLRSASQWPTCEPITLICHSGQRAREAAEHLGRAGFDQLSVVDGGTAACVAAGVPIVRGRKTIPLQRQVVVASGLAVLSGLALALVHPFLLGISWLSAAGMVTAGLTGFCPMAKLLAAAPWNRRLSGRKPTVRAAQGACL